VTLNLLTQQKLITNNMKSMHLLFTNLFFVILVVSFFPSCNRKDKPVIQSNNWHTIYQNDDLDLFSIKFLDKDNGFVFGGLTAYIRPYWQLLLTTTDGGNHWTSDTCKLTAMIYGGISHLIKRRYYALAIIFINLLTPGKPVQI
jgi:hypothetical protein